MRVRSKRAVRMQAFMQSIRAKFLSEGVDGSRPDTAVPSYSWYEYWYRGTTVLACDARVVPVDLAYVIFIDFLALGVLRVCFLLLSNVQFLVLVNLPPGRSHAGGISSRHSRRRYPRLRPRV